MFGYIRVYKPELKLKEISKYSSAYCALCDQLKRDYGPLSRFILNFDITFLLLCLDYFDDNEKENRKIRCPYNGLRVKKTTLSAEALCYSAFINYWLVTEKLYDDYTDDRNFFKSLLRKILISKKQFKKSMCKYNKEIENLSALLHKVYQKEVNIIDSFGFDEVTNAFGEFFAEIFDVISIGKEEKNTLKKLFFQVGKWIYIIDAYDDFEKDIKENRFNLLCSLSDDKMDKAEVFEKTLSLHLQLKQKINLLLKQLKGTFDDNCLINILTFGLDDVFYKITKKRYKENVERLTKNGTSNVE